MRTLFWKIFLSFWAVVAASIVGSLFFRPAAPPLPAWQNLVSDAFAIQGQNLVQAYERGGKPELGRFMQRLRQGSYDQLFLLDAGGNDLGGLEVTPQARHVAERVAADGKVEFARSGDDTLLAERVVSIGDTRYVAVCRFSHVPGLPGPLLRGLAVAMAISGIVCFWLARYLSAPIVRLRNAAQEVAGGNLAARAGKQLNNRRDEIAELVRDFDQMAAQIEKLMCGQQRLISDVSHEFRSPLTRINLAAELIRNVNSPAVKTAVARIEQETERLNSMISNLLTLSKIDAGELLADETIDVAKMLRRIVADTDFEARDHNCRVVLHETQDCTTVGSSDLLRSAVENVIRNAIRYTAQQTEIEVRLTCKINAAFTATISVRDHGPGVPESCLEDLFRPFFRLDESRERSTGGVGLGLAIAQRAVRLHGGEIKAQNCAGQGLEVIISFPVPSSAPLLLQTS